jgi:hypothetical protein
MNDWLHSYDLVGRRADDPYGIRPCGNQGFLALGSGMQIRDWNSPERAVQAPPHVQGGPFTELKLAPTPAAAVAGVIFRRCASSEQPIWEIVADALQADIHHVKAHGVRISDRHADSVLVEGTPRLRTEGENAQRLLIEAAEEDRERVPAGGMAIFEPEGTGKGQSPGWTLLERDFARAIAAVEVPDDDIGYPAKTDWSLVGSSPRLEMLIEDGPLQIEYSGARVRLRDLFEFTDVNGEPAGSRFAYFLTREIAHDLFSLRRQRGFRDWLRFAGSLLTFLGGLGSLTWLASEIFSALF